MRTKTAASLIAGATLVGAGMVSAVVSVPQVAVAQETDQEGQVAPRPLDFLAEVLDELVGEGTIDREDADAVLSAVEAKLTEIKERRQELREMVRGFLEDGVITEGEAAELPDDHWVSSERFEEAWADGELTEEEIRAARPHPRRDLFKRGVRFGALLDDGGIDREEFDSLPDDHPLKSVDGIEEYLGDDLITPEELREIRSQIRDQEASTDT